MKEAFVCAVAIIRKDRQFLIAQRLDGDSFGSFWEFPGGKKHPEETFEQCVIREVKEELGVTVRVDQKFMDVRHAIKDKVVWLHFYLCSSVSGKPRPLGCQKVIWADAAELKDYRFPPANEPVIKKLLQTYV